MTSKGIVGSLYCSSSGCLMSGYHLVLPAMTIHLTEVKTTGLLSHKLKLANQELNKLFVLEVNYLRSLQEQELTNSFYINWYTTGLLF